MDTNDIIGLLEVIGFFIVWAGIGVGISFGFTALVKKHPKLYGLINLPITIYPYVYMIAIAMVLILDENDAAIPSFVSFLVIHPLILASLITDFRTKKIVPAKKIATLNMVNKLVHIPAYIFHFLMGAFGALASIWGIGFLMFAVVVDLITIIISGTFSLAATIGLYKQKRISLPLAIPAAIFSYIYCVDVIAVIVVKIAAVRAEAVHPIES